MHTIIPQENNPVLREKAKRIPLDEIRSKHIQTLIAEMKKLLAKEKYGVAIAACQIGEPLALFIVSGRALSEREKKGESDEEVSSQSDSSGQNEAKADQIYINPTLLKMSRDKKVMHEGCLSIRGFWGMVPRAQKATIRAYDEHGRLFTRGASGFLAHVFQHEMDHLEGILYTDKAKKLYEDSDENE